MTKHNDHPLSPLEIYDFQMRLHDTISETQSFVLGSAAIAVVAHNQDTNTIRTYIFNQSDDPTENYHCAIKFVIPSETFAFTIVGGDISS